jgi:hypothetical protein
MSEAEKKANNIPLLQNRHSQILPALGDFQRYPELSGILTVAIGVPSTSNTRF